MTFSPAGGCCRFGGGRVTLALSAVLGGVNVIVPRGLLLQGAQAVRRP
jgi:hypothetical protein